MDTHTTILVDTFRFLESPRWHDGKLWVSDFFVPQVAHIDLNGTAQTVIELSDLLSAIGWTLSGELLVTSGMARRLLKWENGTFTEVADLSHLVEYPLNEMIVDAQGRIYIGDIGFNFGAPEATPQPGPLLLVTPEGQARIVADGLKFPNGMVITPDGKTLIVAESYGMCLTAFDIEADGSLTNRRLWAKFDFNPDAPSDRQFSPDGICLDAEGAIWVASPGTREVVRVREGGAITHRLQFPTIPIACMLGGNDRRTLFITTTDSLNPYDSGARGRVEMVGVTVPGAGLP